MKAMICEKIKEDSSEYYKRSWRIPHEELSKLGWITIDVSELNNWDKNLSDFFMEKYHEIPKVILFWHTHTHDIIKTHFNNILQTDWIKCLYMDDLHIHGKNRELQAFRESLTSNFDYIFSTYAYTFSRFYPKTDINKVIWYPHNINNKFKVELNDNPINKILLSGAMTVHYPFRNHMKTLVDKYPIDQLEKLNYFKGANHEFYGINYIKYLNKYLVAFTCCSRPRTPYLVNKFFEIPASGALLMAYDELVKEPLKKLGFIDNVNYISVNESNVKEKIDYVLNPKNRKEINMIRQNGYDMVWSNHTLFDRVQIIEKTVNKYIKNNKQNKIHDEIKINIPVHPTQIEIKVDPEPIIRSKNSTSIKAKIAQPPVSATHKSKTICEEKGKIVQKSLQNNSRTKNISYNSNYIIHRNNSYTGSHSSQYATNKSFYDLVKPYLASNMMNKINKK